MAAEVRCTKKYKYMNSNTNPSFINFSTEVVQRGMSALTCPIRLCPVTRLSLQRRFNCLSVGPSRADSVRVSVTRDSAHPRPSHTLMLHQVFPAAALSSLPTI